MGIQSKRITRMLVHILKKAILAIVMLLNTLTSVSYAASTLPRLITQYGCQSCHALDIKRSAPSFQSIAARYEQAPNAKEQLALKLRRGTAGTWGTAAMPPQIMVSDAALPEIVTWVMAQTPRPHSAGATNTPLSPALPSKK